MSGYSVRYLPAAMEDIKEISDWYFSQASGLERFFLSELEGAMVKVASNPFHYQIRYRESRFKILEKFPYRVIFRIFAEEVVVFGVIHAKRSPKLIRKRLK